MPPILSSLVAILMLPLVFCAEPTADAPIEPVLHPLGCRFSGELDPAWETSGDLHLESSDKDRPLRCIDRGRHGTMGMERGLDQLPIGAYRVVLTADLHGGSAATAWIESAGKRSEVRLQPADHPGSAISESVPVSDGSIRFGIRYRAAGDGALTLLSIGVQRCSRPHPGRRLTYAGVTPYSRPGLIFKDGSGADHGSFIEMAHAAGANAVRTNYRTADPQWPVEAALVRRLGMRNICTLLPPSPPATASFAACREFLDGWCREEVARIRRLGFNPDLLLVGNEVNTYDGHLNAYAGWKSPAGDFITNYALTMTSAAKAVRAAGYTGPIGVHFDRPWADGFAKIRAAGFRDFQVAAISLYPKRFNPGYTMEGGVHDMAEFARAADVGVLVIETAAPYTERGGGLHSQDFSPDCVVEVSPAGQAWHLRRVCDLMIGIPDGRGLGVITWGSDLTWGVYPWDHVTWNRAQVTAECVALPSLQVFGEYAASR